VATHEERPAAAPPLLVQLLETSRCLRVGPVAPPDAVVAKIGLVLRRGGADGLVALLERPFSGRDPARGKGQRD
jgi:hypothetical protein